MTKQDDRAAANKRVGVFRRTIRLTVVFCYSVLLGAILTSPMLFIAGAAYLGGRYFERKDSKLAADGITTTATIVDVRFDHLGSLLRGENDNALNRRGAQRDDNAYCKIDYQFHTENGRKIESSISRVYESMDAAKTLIGDKFEVVYSAADPSVYETKLGHTQSQESAMEIIAMVFVALWVTSAIGFGSMTTLSIAKPESRKERIKKLSKKQESKRASNNT